ncbi:MAG: hypothetical protein GX620_01490 [Chloroflexi bacterium]|nr:hypothetical protein [Chloroflexota bacterium]
MRRTTFIGIALAGLVIAALACAPTIPGVQPTAEPIEMPTLVVVPTTEPTVAPTATSEPTVTVEASGGKSGAEATITPPSGEDPGGSKGSGGATGNANLTMINDSGSEICYVYISPTDSEYWGDDWLGGEEIVQPDGQRRFSLPAGTYDLLAEDCSGNTIDERYDVSVAGALEWAVGGAPQGDLRLTLYNNSGSEICYAYISLSTSDTWGGDQLGNSTIPDGEYHDFMVTAGNYDLLAEDCNGNTVDERYGVTISSDRDWSIGSSSQGQAALTIVNSTDVSVYYVFISPSDSDSWGDDWLGNDIIAPGGSYTFYVDEGYYDLRADDMDFNTMATRFGEDVSGDVEWTLFVGDASLTLQNNAQDAVCYVFISPTDSTEWGGDWLGSSEIVDPGTSRLFSLPSGTYDPRADDCSGNILNEQYGVSVQGDMYWTVPR